MACIVVMQGSFRENLTPWCHWASREMFFVLMYHFIEYFRVLLFNQYPVSILLRSGIGLTRKVPMRPNQTVHNKRNAKVRDLERAID